MECVGFGIGVRFDFLILSMIPILGLGSFLIPDMCTILVYLMSQWTTSRALVPDNFDLRSPSLTYKTWARSSIRRTGVLRAAVLIVHGSFGSDMMDVQAQSESGHDSNRSICLLTPARSS